MHYLALLFCILIFSCQKGEVSSYTAYLNHNDTVRYVGKEQCRMCHAEIYDSYIQTGMGKSLNFATKEYSALAGTDMPIIHDSNEINKITSGTMYSCITNEIPVVIPSGTNFMQNIMKYKSYEKSSDLKNTVFKIIKISNNYNFYLNNVKLNSNILKYTLKKDALRKNII